MREPPKLAEASIRALLREHYGMPDATLVFLPLGADAASSVYRVEAGGAAFLLKARAQGGFSLPSLSVPAWLCGQGLTQVLAPLPSASGALWVDAGAFALSLYPFIDGRMAADAGLSDAHWRALGATVRRMHASQPPPALLQTLRREPFAPNRRGRVADLQAALAAPADALARELAAFWRAHQVQITALLERVDTLGPLLRGQGAPLVLCHADLHTWNLMLDTQQRLWLIDWDTTMLALPERDLMFVVGGIGSGLVSPHQSACFLEGYGETVLDPRALAYYRAAWAVQDMIEFGDQALLAPDISPAARREAADWLMLQFRPGNMVEIALESGVNG